MSKGKPTQADKFKTAADGQAAEGQARITQIERFKALARELEADEDESRWDERLKKIAQQKPAPEKSE